MALPLPDGRWKPLAMEPNRWMALDTGWSLPLPVPLARLGLGLLAGTNQWPDSLLQLLDPVIRIVSEELN